MIDVSFLAQSPDWRWSFSRLQQFHSCKYAWLLKYVFEVPSQKLFFSEYGKLIHDLIAQVLADKITWREAETEYLRRFHSVLRCYGPPGSIQAGYFMDGLRYFREGNANLQHFQPLFVEQYVDFEIADHPLRGYIDLIARKDNALCIVDHKSRALKERNPRRTKSNALLDAYLRQLYLYSIPVSQQFGTPEYLIFNCFRGGLLIKERFSQAAFDETVAWAQRTIDEILCEKGWVPCCESWKCRYLCDVAGACEYFTGSR